MKIVRATAILLGLFFLIGALVSCGSSKVTPTPGPTPTVTPNNGKVIEKTVAELVSEVLKNPGENPYERGALIRVSGFVAELDQQLGRYYLFLGPVEDWHAAILYPLDGSLEMLNIFRQAQKGDWIVVDAEYDIRIPGDNVILLKGRRVIEFKALQ